MVQSVTHTTGMLPVDIALERLHADEDFNCRGPILPLDVIDLARSMKGPTGLLNPITVTPYNEQKRLETGKDYLIVAGYRRAKAAQINEWSTIPCIIKEGLSELDCRLINLGENLNRKNLNILQEAKALAHLSSLGQDDVARYLNQSRGWVQVRFYLLTLPPEIQEEAASGLLTQQQIRDLHALTSNGERFEAVKRIKDARVRGDKTPVKVKEKKTSIYAKKTRDRGEIFDMMEHIQGAVGNSFGTRTLAWAAGEISSSDLFRDIKEIADEADKPYTPPREVMSQMSIGIA